MEAMTSSTFDRVRNNTPDALNEEIDQKTRQNIQYYSSRDERQIKEWIKELDKEWDIERTLELNASLIAMGGIILSATVNKRWLVLPFMVTSFLAQHAIQGWCPPLPLFRKMGIRTRKEIEKERYALLKVIDDKKTMDDDY